MKTGMKILELLGIAVYKVLCWVAKVVEGRK